MDAVTTTTPKSQTPKRQNQWAIIWREFKKRRLAMFALGLIVFLVTISVFAPILANNRPLVYRGANYFAFREAVRNTLVLTNQIVQNKNQPDVGTLSRQLELIAVHLESDKMPAFQKLRELILNLANSESITANDRSEMGRLRTELRSGFNPRKTQLATRTYYPFVDSINWLDIVCMLILLLLFLTPVWRPLWQRLCTSYPRLGLPIFLVVIPLVAGGIWKLAVPDRVDRTNYKSAIFADSFNGSQTVDVVYEAAVWPLVPYGLDESDLKSHTLKPGERSLDKNVSNPWNQVHYLGTDEIGRDVLCRMIWGGRVSLSVGIVAVSIYLTIGIIVGSLAGFFRGWVDIVISRIIEIVICFPSFFLILTIVVFVGESIWNIMVVIGLTGWTGVARLVRGEFLRLANQEFVLAGRSLGYSSTRIIFRHILPNALAPVLVNATFGIAGAILTESGLSFLGFGIEVPTPSWGGILSSGRDAFFRAPYLILFPGMAIFLTITAYNLVGEAFRDASDPRLRGQY